MVPVNVGDQDEVGLGKSRELRGLGGIEINHLTAGLDQRAGVVQRSDLDRPAEVGNICGSAAACASVASAKQSEKMEHETIKIAFMVNLTLFRMSS